MRRSRFCTQPIRCLLLIGFDSLRAAEEGAEGLERSLGRPGSTFAGWRGSSSGQQVMPRSLEQDKRGSSGNQIESRPHLFDRPERVARALNKKRRSAQGRKMVRAKFGRQARRMKRVGEKQQSVGDGGIFGGEQRGLASAVGMAAEKYPGALERNLLKRHDRIPQSLAVPGGVSAKGRSVRTLLPVGKVTAEHREAGAGEDGCEGRKQSRFAIRARAVGEHQGVRGRLGGAVQEAAYRRREVTRERSCFRMGFASQAEPPECQAGIITPTSDHALASPGDLRSTRRHADGNRRGVPRPLGSRHIAAPPSPGCGPA